MSASSSDNSLLPPPSSPSSVEEKPSSAGSMFRSEEMRYVSIAMTNDIAYQTIRALGRHGKFHVVDLAGHKDASPSKQQIYYKKRINDCIFWEKKLQFFQDQLHKFKVKYSDDGVKSDSKSGDVLDEVSDNMSSLEKEFTMSLNFLSEIERNINELIERKNVLTIGQRLSYELQGQLNTLKEERRQRVETGEKGRADELKINDHRQTQTGGELKASSALNSSTPTLGEPLIGSRNGLELSERKGPNWSAENPERFKNSLCGVLPQETVGSLSRLVYRVSRGNAIVRFEDIPEAITDPVSGEAVKKAVFYIVFVGQHLGPRIAKLCPFVRAAIYEMSDDAIQVQRELENIEKEIHEKETTETKTKESIVTLLQKLSGNQEYCPLLSYQELVRQEKLISEVFMKAYYYNTLTVLEGWSPEEQLTTLKYAVVGAVEGSGLPPAAVEVDPVGPLGSTEQKPTYFKLTKFTSTFQAIVDTYGVPRYKEVNPGLFTVITFPFLFGVMYGDMGHGTLLTIFSLILLINEKKLDALQKKKQLGEIYSMAFAGRYLLLLMGLFATYCGVIYNDCFSLSVRLYDERWSHPPTTGNDTINYIPLNMSTPYPLGLDPSWSNTANQLAFYNSFKMKLAIIIGVVHMSFGIILSVYNHVYFKDYVAIFLEFIPRILFLWAIFGYMVFLIIFKWCTQYENTNSAPALIQVMIKMFLSPGSVAADLVVYDGQAGVQTALILIAVLNVPVMLFGKPLAHKFMHKKHGQHEQAALLPNGQADPSSRIGVVSEAREDSKTIAVAVDPVDADKSKAIDSEEKQVDTSAAPAGADKAATVVSSDEHSFADEMIHQGIHTIEFVLGTVSNTASYLRLWALSLAHAELSDVFWSKLMLQYGIKNGSPIFAVVGFGAWFGATFAVLLCMDTLECFLHALRLHWVEFQNKFYYADGRPFEPFTFEEQY